jgi:hypothetical protein
LHGGISSGLNVVSHEKEPKLFIVKGKRQPIVRQLHTIGWKEFNDGDVFVLDAVQNIFVWTGKQSNRLERIQGAKVRSSNQTKQFKNKFFGHLSFLSFCINFFIESFKLRLKNTGVRMMLTRYLLDIFLG